MTPPQEYFYKVMKNQTIVANTKKIQFQVQAAMTTAIPISIKQNKQDQQMSVFSAKRQDSSTKKKKKNRRKLSTPSRKKNKKLERKDWDRIDLKNNKFLLVFDLLECSNVTKKASRKVQVHSTTTLVKAYTFPYIDVIKSDQKHPTSLQGKIRSPQSPLQILKPLKPSPSSRLLPTSIILWHPQTKLKLLLQIEQIPFLTK